MKKGLINTLIFYGICLIIFVLLSKYTRQPAHFFGLNFLLLFLVFFISIAGIIFHLANVVIEKNTKFNLGALIIHSIYSTGVIIWYLIGYYSQFA